MKAAQRASTRPRAIGGRYELGEPIGRGGMGVVYAARDRRLDRPVAVKLLEDGSVDAEREARAAARLVHPNVVVVLDVGVDRGRPFIVMERVEGVTLADELSNGPLTVHAAVSMTGEVLAALGAAHAMGIVHGDVKPGNILRARDRWKVADFGIARFVDTDTTGTITGDVVGSPSYVAPERFDGVPATERGDIYGVGVVLYEALAGARPFVGNDGWAVAVAVREGRFEPLRSRRPDLDARLCDLVERAMARDPADRYGSAAEMASALPDGGPRVRSEPTVRIPPLDATAVLPDIASADSVEPVVLPTPVAEPVPEPEVVAASRTTRHSRGRPQWFRTAAVLAALALALLIATLGLALFGGGGSAPARARFPSLTPSVPATVSPAPTIEPSPAFGAHGGNEGEGQGNHNGFENGQGNKHGED